METNPYAAPLAPTDVAPAGAGPVRVGFGPRFGAALIDGLITWVVGVVIAGAVVAAFPEYLQSVLARAQPKADPNMPAQLAMMTSWVTSFARWSMGATVFGLAYHLLTEGVFARSLGKLMLGLRIADVNGRKAPIGRLLGRAAFKESGPAVALLAMLTKSHALVLAARVPAWIYFLGCLFVFAHHRRAFHDFAAGTAVYRNSDVVDR